MTRRWFGVRRVFRLPTTAARMRADVDAELAFHIQGRVDELVAQGMSRADAEREARERFGDYNAIEIEVEQLQSRRTRRVALRDRIETTMTDLRHTLRTLVRQPLFSLVVVATLTLGIGTTAAIFHAVDRIVLHPLPYPDADRIVYLGSQRRLGLDIGAVSAGRFQFWHDHSHVFEGLATSRTFDAALDGLESDAMPGILVTAEYLGIIGARPAFGRPLLAADYEPGAARVALISDGLWKRKFGSDRSVLGAHLRLNDSSFTIIGVLQPDFEIAELSTPPDVVSALAFTSMQLQTGGANYTAIGKLRPHLTAEQIDSDMATVLARLRETYPDQVDADDLGAVVVDFSHIVAGAATTPLWIFLGATAFIFILACANVANIVLARAIGRQREFAVRTALGAARSRIVRQILLEMGILGCVSAVCAIGASLLTVRWIANVGSKLFIRQSQLQLDWRVVALIAAISALASLIIGGAVSLMTTRVDLTNGLAASTRGSGIGDRRGRLRATLVGIEAALAMVLLAGAGLLIMSFARVMQVDSGFRRTGVYTARISRTPRSYSNANAIFQFDERVLATLRATPGIQSASSTATLPLTRGWNIPTTVEGRDDATLGGTEWRSVSPGYFRAMDIPILAGRDLSEADSPTAPPVVLVSKAYAARFFPDENPIGRRIYIGIYKGRGKERVIPSEIVGVVGDLRDQSLDEPKLRQTVWVSNAQATFVMGGLSAFVVRANDPSVAATALRRAIAEADPRLPVADIASMDDIVAKSLGTRRFSMVLLTTFALVALTLTCVGIYGVASYSVSQRTREIGVRIALGAQTTSVVGLVVRQAIRPAIIGVIVGTVLALGLSRVITSLLFGIGPRDPLSFAIVAGLLTMVAIVASYVPARRAARVDPVTALRAD